MMKKIIKLFFLLFCFLFLNGCPPDKMPTLSDVDHDGWLDGIDLCPNVPDTKSAKKSEDQADLDGDKVGDDCDSCPFIPNPDPEDQEFWANCGDYSDVDADNDCVGDSCDNCPEVFNPDQKDNNNGVGDACAE